MTEPKITREEIELVIRAAKGESVYVSLDMDKVAAMATLALQALDMEPRIRLLEQQLKTAREALKPLAREANHRPWCETTDPTYPIGGSSLTYADIIRAAAAIRSLGEPSAHPPGE